MKRIFLLMLITVISTTAFSADLEWAPGEVLAKLGSEAFITLDNGQFSVMQNTVSLLEKNGAASIEPVFNTPNTKEMISLDQWVLIRCKAGVSEQTVLENIQNLDLVEKVSLNTKVYLDDMPNDPDYDRQYAWELLRAEDAWDLVHGSPDVVVAIIDSGADMDHEDLAAGIWTNTAEIADNGVDDDGNGYVDDTVGWDFNGDDNDPDNVSADNDHGTHVAGIVGAISNNGVGVAGGSWNCPVMILKVFPNSGGGAYVDDVAAALRYAADNGAAVINLSLGGTGNAPVQEEAVFYAYSAGCVVLASSGNGGNDGIGDPTPHYPSGNVGAIGVGSVNKFNEKDGSSNYGEDWVDVFAPGVAIRSTLPGNNYGNLTGTSMSSPVAAALAALIVSQNPGITPDEVELRMEAGCVNIDFANPVYNGLLDPGRISFLYSLAETPIIEVEKWLVNDSSGNNNHEADQGETVTLDLYLKNHSWMDGNNVNVTVSTGSGVTVNDGTANYGSMVSKEVKSNLDALSFAITSAAETMVEITVEITADGGYLTTEVFQLSINNPVPPLPGFPVNSWSDYNASPRVADLNNDGQNEIIVVSNDGSVKVFNSDGTMYPGWPVTMMSTQYFDSILILAPPSIADINMDGNLDIIIADQYQDVELINPNNPSAGTKSRILGRIHVFNHDGTYQSGWPWTTNSAFVETDPAQTGFKSGPTIADITGDDHYEIIIGNYGNHVFALDYQGNKLDGWPRNLETDIFASAAAFDYDMDSKDEIVVVTKDDTEPLDSGALYLFDGDGTQMPGFPVLWNNQIYSAPVLADMDGDAIPEIIFGYGDYSNEVEPKGITVLDMRSEPLPGWPVSLPNTVYASPGLGDLDQDGDLEIVVTTFGAELCAYHHDGTPVAGFPVTVSADPEASITSSPAIADVDNDGTPEIIFSLEIGYHVEATLHVFGANGVEKSYSPMMLEQSAFSSPAVADVDGNGTVEIIITDNTTAVFNMNSDYDPNMQYWTTYHGNNLNTGLYGMNQELKSGVNLMITDPMFTGGEIFALDAVLVNGESTTATDLDLYIILDVYGMYWFYPSWAQTADWEDISELPPGNMFKNVFTFPWPSGIAGVVEGLIFWGGLLDSNIQLFGDIDFVTFGYSE